jgi:hypothetical protein
MGADVHVTNDNNSWVLEPLCEPQSDTQDLKPGLGRAFLKGLVLCFPVASAIWAGIIYSASRLAR